MTCDLHKRKPPLHIGAVLSKVRHPMDGHQPFTLRYDLIYDPGGAIGDNGDTDDLVIISDLRHRQAFEIIDERSEHDGDSGNSAILVGTSTRHDQIRREMCGAKGMRE